MLTKIEQFDTYLTQKIGRFPERWVPLFHALGVVTMPLVWSAALLLLVLAGTLPSEYHGDALIVAVLVPVGFILKMLFKRRRPSTSYSRNMKLATPSFPSGHAFASMLVLGSGMVVLVVNGSSIYVVPLIVTLVILGVSRVRLGAHHPSDVIGGWLFAIVFLVILFNAA